MAKEIPVYLFTGFMDSGKTTFINNTIYGSEFKNSGEKILVICCEDGDEEYDEEKMKTVNAQLVMIENEEEFTYDFLKKLNSEYKPDNIFIEYNGTWSVSKLYEMRKPEGWILAQAIAVVDATTFDMYQMNMKAIMNDQFLRAELVIFNRCDDNTPKSRFRGIVKSVNRPATIAYQLLDGSFDDNEELPYDINADHLEISDADYAIWFMDCMDNSKRYNGKTIHFLGVVYNPPEGKLKRSEIALGRFAMTCCADDIQYLGMKTKYEKAYELEHKSFVDVTCQIKIEFAKEYRGLGPVLHIIDVKPAEKPEDELVYFS